MLSETYRSSYLTYKRFTLIPFWSYSFQDLLLSTLRIIKWKKKSISTEPSEIISQRQYFVLENLSFK